jgi:hypothetical protein
MSDGESRSWLGCLGWGCLIVVVIAIVGIGGCVFVLYRGTAGASTVTDLYLESVVDGRWEEAYEQLGPVFRNDNRLEDFVAFEQAARHELGRCDSSQHRGISLDHREGRTLATLTYRLQCEKGAARVVFTVEKVEDAWLIQGVRYGEADAAPFPTCTECDGVLPPGSRFCPYCGAATGDGSEVQAEDVEMNVDGARSSGASE